MNGEKEHKVSKILLPFVRQILPKAMAHEIISVQPMGASEKEQLKLMIERIEIEKISDTKSEDNKFSLRYKYPR